MVNYITSIRTTNGDLPYDYNSLANLPQPDITLSKSGGFADAKATGNAIKNLLPKSGGIMTGAISTRGIILTENEDYGTEFPSSPESGRLFFKKVT